MDKTVDAFRTISEVAEGLDLPQHVLRFWETRFPQIKPLKRAGGRRFYRPDDVELLRTIRQLLYADGYTIKGVQRILKEHGVRAVIAMQGQRGLMPPPATEPAPPPPPMLRLEPRFGDAGEVTPEDKTMQATDSRLHPAPAQDVTPGGAGRYETRAHEVAPGDWPADANAESPADSVGRTPLQGFAGAKLDATLAQHLKAPLFELAECARILDAARRAA